MLPKVILYNAVSLDGRIDGFPIDVPKYYELAARFGEDATLCGSETILAGLAREGLPNTDGDAKPPEAGDPNDTRALLAVCDSRGRVRCWNYLRSLPYWRGAVALCSKATPREYRDHLAERHVESIVAGDEHVDLRATLGELNARYGATRVRVDSGGVLNGLLLKAGLVDEVALLIHPSLVGGAKHQTFFVSPDPASPGEAIALNLLEFERLDGGILWARYEMAK